MKRFRNLRCRLQVPCGYYYGTPESRTRRSKLPGRGKLEAPWIGISMALALNMLHVHLVALVDRQIRRIVLAKLGVPTLSLCATSFRILSA